MNSNSVARPNGSRTAPTEGPQASPTAVRQDDTLYQENQPVAKTLEAEVDLEAKEVYFGELYESDPLLLPDECEYQEYRILIRKVAFAASLDNNAPHKGRVLRGVVAEILGHTEQ